MGKRLRRRGAVAPLLLVLGAGLATSVLTVSTLLRLARVPAPVDFQGVPSVVQAHTSLNGRGVPIQSPAPITVTVVGDVMLGRQVASRTQQSGDPAYPFEHLPKDWFNQFDFVVGNLEGPVTDKRRSPEKTIDFLFDPSVLDLLKSEGFDGFSQANNHALDQGRLGYEDSIRRLGSAGFAVFGDQVRDGNEALAVVPIRSKVFAFVGFNTTDNAFDEEAASSVLTEAKRRADTVIVMMHWGAEYRDRPQTKEIENAHWLIDHGADVVIGGHPHWEQGFSVYKGKPIAWSLGNFIFDQDWSQKTREGLVLTLSFDSAQTAIEIRPVFIDKSRPGFVEGAEKQRRLDALAAVSDEALRDQIRSGTLTVE